MYVVEVLLSCCLKFEDMEEHVHLCCYSWYLALSVLTAKRAFKQVRGPKLETCTEYH